MFHDILGSAPPAQDASSLLDAGIIALLGYAVVFLGLIILMVVVIALTKVINIKFRKPVKKTAVTAAPVSAPVQVAAPATAPGTAGALKLHDVPPKTAAMLMAIVAEKTGKPLYELRFISIKEVK